MLRPKKKISKRALKEDALITSYVKATTLYEENKKAISIGITVLVLAIIVSVVYVKNRTANNEKASEQLGEVYRFYDNGQYQFAVEGVPERNVTGLKAIVDNYGGTKAGEIARFYLANAYYQLGRYDEALSEFEDFSTSDDLLSVSRLSGIACCYEAKGKHEDAAEYFEKAASKHSEDVNAAENLNNAARNYGLAGQKDKAIDLYKRLKKNYPTSTFAREADRFITQFSV